MNKNKLIHKKVILFCIIAFVFNVSGIRLGLNASEKIPETLKIINYKNKHYVSLYDFSIYGIDYNLSNLWEKKWI